MTQALPLGKEALLVGVKCPTRATDGPADPALPASELIPSRSPDRLSCSYNRHANALLNRRRIDLSRLSRPRRSSATTTSSRTSSILSSTSFWVHPDTGEGVVTSLPLTSITDSFETSSAYCTIGLPTLPPTKTVA